ncbi:MAG TPA: hypothetical protein VGK31_14275, partial [Thermoanaerobaculia bacterium]
TTEADLVLVATRDAVDYDIDLFRRRLTQGPYAAAMHLAWRVESAEGFLSNFVGNDRLPAALGTTKDLNTDDRTLIEFGFGRSVGDRGRFDLNQLIAFSRGAGTHRPSHVLGTVNWREVELNRWHDPSYELSPLETDEQVRSRAEFTNLYDGDNFAGALSLWEKEPFAPVNSTELSRIAEVLAEAGREDAIPLVDRLRPQEPTEADALLARVRLRQQRYADSAAALERALVRYQADPRPDMNVMGHALDTAASLARIDHRLAPHIFDLLSKPFSTGQWGDTRKIYRIHVAHAGEGCGPRTVAALRAMEPDFPWAYDLLKVRRQCYAAAHVGALAKRANEEWKEFTDAEPQSLSPR